MTQAEALDILKTGKNVFVTGAAGSGKTHLINSYISYLRSHSINVGITASTGIAATHMSGVTIHSWAGIGIRAHLSAYDIESLLEKSYLFERFRKVKVLIIDEVSMLHHFRFDMVNSVLKAMKGNDLPFGGIQVVLCGDFFQLPPVVRNGEQEAHFIYESTSWAEGEFSICYLEEQFRQKDDSLLTILNEIRSGTVSKESKDILKKRLSKSKEEDVYSSTQLFTHNIDVDQINSKHLGRLETIEQETYVMEEKGKDFLIELLKKSCMAPQSLQLKIGARVMCVKNNFDVGYVNGTLGIVTSCRPGGDPKIKTLDGRIITIERASWKIEEDKKVLAEIKQYPLRHAWAITVHKSQGMSLDEVEVDLSKAFESGMGYVALSRVRTLKGLRLSGINEQALKVRDDVLEFDASLKDLSLDAKEYHKKLSAKDLEQLHLSFRLHSQPQSKTSKRRVGSNGIAFDEHDEVQLSTYEKTAALIEDGKSLKEMAKERGVNEETIVAHIETLLSDEVDIDISYLKREISKPHFKKIEEAISALTSGASDDIFENSSQNDEISEKGIALAPIKHKVGANISYLHIRLARAVLGFVPKKKS